MDSFYSLQRNAAAGVDRVTWREYEQILLEQVIGPWLNRVVQGYFN